MEEGEGVLDVTMEYPHQTPEQAADRLRSELDHAHAQLQTAADLGLALQQDTEGKDEQLAELEEALAEKTRELEEAQ